MRNFFQVSLGNPLHGKGSNFSCFVGFKGQVESIVSNPIRWNSAIEEARLQIQQLKELQQRDKRIAPPAAATTSNRIITNVKKAWKGKGRAMGVGVGVEVTEKVKEDGTRIARIEKNATTIA
jgi:hypothetical protein